MTPRWVWIEGDGGVGDVTPGLLELHGSVGVVEEPQTWRAYFPAPSDPEVWWAELVAAFAAAGLAPPRRWGWQDDEDWLAGWKARWRPQRVGRRFVVTPSWEDVPAQPGDLVLRLDPGMAFGTGDHPTTRSCLRLLEAALRPGERVLDIGTGSGVLAIAAALLGARHVYAVDHDPEAVRTARENVARHGLEDRVRVELVEVNAEVLPRLGPVDLVLANLLSSLLLPLLPALPGTLAARGRAILAGLLETERPAFEAALQAAGLRVVATDEEANDEGGWWSACVEPNRNEAHGRDHEDRL